MCNVFLITTHINLSGFDDHLDFAAVYNSDFSLYIGIPYVGGFGLSSNDGAISGDNWHHIFSGYDINHPSGSRIGYLYIDGVNVSNPSLIVDIGTSSIIDTWENIIIPATNDIAYGSVNPFNIMDRLIHLT